MLKNFKFGIFPKLLLFSLIASLIPLGAIVYVSYRDMTSIGGLMLTEGKDSLEKLGAESIKGTAKHVAKQLEVYIKAHPEMAAYELQQNEEFKALAVQPVGKTGYTAVQDAHSAVNLFHKNPKIVNMDLHKLENKLPEFWAIMEQSLGGKDSSGYYDWTDADGKTREKFMYITALNSKTADGVLMGVAATTYLDEFSQPMIKLDRTVSSLIQEKLNFFYIIIGATAIFVLLIFYLLAKSITRPIMYLAKVADEISTGKLGTKIEISSRDEIGVLISSLKRMQRSLALAIKKLKEREVSAPRRRATA